MFFIETFRESMKGIWRLKNIYFKPLFIPIILLQLVAINTVNNYFIVGKSLTSIIEIAAYTLLTITIHRLLILGEKSVPSMGIYKPSYREFSFVMHAVGISFFTLPIGLLSAIPILPSIIIIPLTYILSLYIFSRFSLVFPAIATDAGWSFSDSWKVTKEYKIFVFSILAIVPGLFTFLLVFSGLISNGQNILLFFYPFCAVIFISLLSMTYVKLTALEPINKIY